MKFLMLLIPLCLVLIFQACGTNGFEASAKMNSASDPTHNIEAANIGSTHTSATDTNSEFSTEDVTRALEEIKLMTQTQCRDAFQLNTEFYEATRDMSEAERRAYFDTFVEAVLARGLPAPRPPPPPGGVVFKALLECAE